MEEGVERMRIVMGFRGMGFVVRVRRCGENGNYPQNLCLKI
jgi:hypothetical protein